MGTGASLPVTCSRLSVPVVFNAMLFPDLPDRVAEVRANIREAVARGGHGQQVRIVAVTKTHPPESARAALAAGVEDVGENRVQEALSKIEALPDLPVRWHLIGHLQRNKVKFVESFELVHAIDSSRLADAVNSWACANEREVNVLLQVNVSGEGTKGGFPLEVVPEQAESLLQLTGMKVRGVMTMAPYEAPEQTLREVFSGAREARDVLRAAGHPADELSMGMSGDYQVAVEEGATLVRLGTILFGTRS